MVLASCAAAATVALPPKAFGERCAPALALASASFVAAASGACDSEALGRRPVLTVGLALSEALPPAELREWFPRAPRRLGSATGSAATTTSNNDNERMDLAMDRRGRQRARTADGAGIS
uniref:Uncharacterized protein n=1 Tax=Alexandrium catenella TaxID=2925 RepID=A0A7S1WQ83_ALECA